VIALTGEFKNVPRQRIEINVENVPRQEVKITQDVIIVPVYKDVTLYEGDYEVTPRVREQTLPTADKLLSEDVRIKEIPYYDVSNPSGGSTVYIAREI
jgi:hypothetical protein